MKKAVVLFNLGGPDSLDSVQPFLFNLFYDRRIINLPNPFRFLLAKFIAHIRKKSALKIYEKIGGRSPILENTKVQAAMLEQMLNQKENNRYKVFVCMRYSHPFADETIKNVKQFNPDKIILLPLYPQYSTTTTLSAIQNWNEVIKKHNVNYDTKIICCYYKNKNFIEAHAELIIKYYKLASRISKPRVLFSAHSLPISIVQKGDPYVMQVEETVKLIVKALNIESLDFIICYQSKIGPIKWLTPSTESELLRAKIDNVPIVLSPITFVSEHSETLVELDIEYKQLVNEKHYFRVPTLNTDHLFIKCLSDLCLNNFQNQCMHTHKMCWYMCKNPQVLLDK
ncbi:ferrochelatase [Wolbachia endosymbiont of Pentidionis agamae]|uniref:ferrochelatase n=1 Tax=Wolbachia endosymbiont of Pentidionis agamae TaxID=3110435 RepID=UPI002FD558F0